MTINKQALRIPEREKHNWGQAVMHTCDFCDHYAMTITTEDGEHSCASCCDAEYTTVLRCTLEMAIDCATAAEKRIAELEAREVVLTGRYDIHEMSRNPFESYRCIEPDADGDYLRRDDVIEALAAAGISIKGE